MAVCIYDLYFDWILKDVRKKVLEFGDVKPKQKVLEIACGSGKQAMMFARKYADVIGIDVSDEALGRARRRHNFRYKNLRFMCQDGSKLYFKDNSFDVSTITLGLHEMHPEVREKVLAEMIRVTKKKLIITDFCHVEKEKKLWKRFKQKLIIAKIKFLERLIGKDNYSYYNHFMENGGIEKLLDLKVEEKHKFFLNNVCVVSFELSDSINQNPGT